MKIRELFENKIVSVKDYNLSKDGEEVSPKSGVREVWERDLDIRMKNISSLEGSPKKIKGAFNCSFNNLTSLEFGPEETKDFYCSNNQLTSLEFSPKKINGIFSCSDNKNLKSLKGMPQEDITNMSIYGCDLQTLDGCPKKINGAFNCSKNPNLNSLKGMPQEGVSEISCGECNLTSFEGAPKKIEHSVTAVNNPIKHLKNIHKIFEQIGASFILPDSIESNILGLLKIKDLKRVRFFKGFAGPGGNLEQTKPELTEIINKYLPNPTPSQIIDCQNELIDAGFEEYAEL